MKNYLYIIFLLLFQLSFSQQDETIQLNYDTSGYKPVNLSSPLSKTSSPNDTIPTIKSELNVNDIGGATFNLPIEVFKGTNNFQPNISLSYSSQQGNGQAGWGWNIVGLSVINQGGKSKYIDGITEGRQFNSLDPYYLDGQRLIQMSSNIFETEKYSKIKIIKNSNGSTFSFEIRYTDGKIAKYAELVSGQHYISSLSDAFGNEIHYKYSLNYNTVLLDSISYGGTSISNDKFFINFNYLNRLVPIKSYRNGIEYVSSKVLKSINVVSAFLTQNSGIFRKYILTHDYIQSNTVERLIQIDVENETGLKLKPLKFGYNQSNYGLVDFKWHSNNYPRSTTYGISFVGLGSVTMGDYYGNGNVSQIIEGKLSDNTYFIFNSFSNSYIEQGNSVSKDLCTGRVLFNNKITSNDALIISHCDYTGSQSTDMFGNQTGTPLIDKYTFKIQSLSPYNQKIVTINLPGGYVPLGSTIFNNYSSSSFPFSSSGSTIRDEKGRKIISGDFNNDGLLDLLILENSNNTRVKKVYFCEIGKADQGDATPIQLSFTDFDFKNTFNPIEFDGDGRPEIMSTNENGSMCVFKIDFFNNTFNKITSVTTTLSNFDKNTPVLFGDYNGDGLTDFLTPQKMYDINGSTVASEMAKINSEQQLWWEYISTGTNFIKTQKDFTQQKLAYFKNSQRNIIKESSDWDKFWSGKPDTYEYTEYGTSGIIPVDINDDGRTDLVSVQCFGNIKYSQVGINYAEILDNYTTAYNKATFIENKQGANNSTNYTTLLVKPLVHNKISPFSLITNYADYNYLSAYKSGLRIYDIIKGSDFGIVVNNSEFKEGQITKVDNGSPVVKLIEYKPMVEKNNNNREDVYTTTNLNLNYPFNINKNLGTSYLVAKLHTTFDNTILTKEYRYVNAIQDLSGRGFIGFQKTVISDPYESIYANGKYTMKDLFTAHFWKTNTYDPLFENSLLQTTYGSLNDNSLFNKCDYTNQKITKGNNRYQILTTVEVNKDFLTNVTTTKSYSYDTSGDFLLTQANTNYSNVASSIEKFEYQSEFSNGDHYFFGKINKIEKSTFKGGDVFTTKEEQSYNPDGSIQKVKKYGNGTPAIETSFTYFPFGSIQTETVSTIGVSPTTTSYEYEPTNRFVNKITNPDLLKTVFNVNFLGRIISETNTLGNITYYSYDSWGNITSNTDFLGKKTKMSRSATSEPKGYYSISTKRDGGLEEIVIYDIFDRVIKKKVQSLNNQWQITEWEYDIFGNKIKESLPYFSGETPKWNVIEYDYLHRPIKTTAYNGKVIATCYEGLKVTVDDGTKKSSKQLDPLGNVVKIHDGGGEIFYKYYPNGSLKETDYEGIKTIVEIDGWGNKTKLIEPSAGTYLYEYDNLSRLKKETNPKGGVTEYTYDNFGKLLTENTNSPAENTVLLKNYQYDNTTKLPTVITGTMNGKSYTYTTEYNDPYKRVTRKIEQTPEFSYENSILSYDSYGRPYEIEQKTTLVSPSYTTTTKIRNNYDANGILTSQTDLQSGDIIWTINSINSQGKVTQMKYGNGYVIQNSYNSSNFHLQKIKHSLGIQTLLEIDYSYDNLKNVLNSRNNITFGKNESFTYDDLDRLLEERLNGSLTNSYTYDKRGRMTSNTALGQYNYSNQNYRLESISFNANGSQVNTNRGFAEIKYNAFKNPVSIHLANKDRLSFDYSILETRSVCYYGSLDVNPLNRPNVKYYSSDKAVEVVKEGATTKIITYITGDAYSANYVKIDVLTSGTLASSNKYYLHRDNQNTILAITKADFSGTVVEKRFFDAWGNLKAATINGVAFTPNQLGWVNGLLIDKGYTGHEHLKTVGLIHMNGRIYDPIMHKFLSPDNYVQEPHNTQSYNRFGYVFNNPLFYTDPSGELAFGIAVLIAVGVAVLVNGISNSINGTPFWYGTGKAATMGAISGAISFGIGSVATSSFTSTVSQAAFQAGMHAVVGGVMSEIEGGKFATGFASGAVSSVVSSGVGALGGKATNINSFANRNTAIFKAIMVASGGLSGGIGSVIAGGSFWSGVRQGIITAGLNHAAHYGASLLEKTPLEIALEKAGYDPDEIAAWSNEQIKEFAAKVFPELFNSANCPNFEVRDIISDNPDIMGQALKTATQNSKTGEYKVVSKGLILINKVVLNSVRHLGTVVGHELNHVVDHVNGTYAYWANFYKDIYAGNNFSELKAYSWQLNNCGQAFFSTQEYNHQLNKQSTNNWKY